MTGQGQFTRKPGRQLRIMMAGQVFWLGTVLILAGWWGFLVLRQAERISELEAQAGLSPLKIETQWHSTQRMLFWESSTFFVLLLISTLFLFRLYWREMGRTRALQAFFASVTHELRTPLTSIRLQAESIADAFKPESRERVLVSRLLEDTTRLESQVERTLELARVEGGGPLFTQPIRLKAAVDRVARTWLESYPERMELHIQMDDLSVEADSTAIQVILKNLFENSLRHARADKVSMKLSANRESGMICVKVRDSGQGFVGSAEALGKIFEKGPHSQGAGVGLYLIQKLMERMGGRAHFLGGSGFEVRLWFKEALDG